MKTTCQVAVCFWICCFSTATAEDLVRQISWKQLEESGQLQTGSIVQDATHGAVLIVEASGDQPTTTLLEIENPGVTGPVYGLEGHIRYEGVSAQGFLELWNHFPDETAYFTRTLDNKGPMQSLKGESEWRRFVLPFSMEADPDVPPPVKLQFNVVLPQGGKVWISDLKLKQFSSAAAATAASDAWWNDGKGGWIGGWAGALLGVLGGVIGTLAGMGRARSLTRGLHVAGILVGVICLVTGVTAVLIGQPYGVYYPLLLCGLLATVILGSLYPVIQQQYAAHELRRMQSVDA